MRQKDIYLINLNPTKGAEQQGVRLAVVISGNTMNDNLDICIICPITSKIKNYEACVVLKKSNLNNLTSNSEVITFQIRTISKNRLIKKIGEISDQELKQIFLGINDIFIY